MRWTLQIEPPPGPHPLWARTPPSPLPLAPEPQQALWVGENSTTLLANPGLLEGASLSASMLPDPSISPS